MEYIYCFGDSLTFFGYESGWVSRLSKQYVRRAHVLNCGLPGYNTRWYLDVLRTPEKRATLYPDHIRAPLFATLLLGSNDCANNTQNVPVEEYMTNMTAILTFIHEEIKPRHGIFVLTPPPINQVAWKAFMQFPETDRSLDSAWQYRCAVLKVVAAAQKSHPEMQVRLVDTHSAVLHYACPATAAAAAADPNWEPQYDTDAPWTRLLQDGLHINETGGEVFFAALWEAIRTSEKARELDPMKMTWLLPDHLALMEQERLRREHEAAKK